MFICERKFYALTYARKNYATLEINPNLLEILYQKEVLRPLYADREIQQFSSWSSPCFIVFSLSLFIAAAIDPANARAYRAMLYGRGEIQLAPIDLFHNGAAY